MAKGILIIDGVCYTGTDDWRWKKVKPSKLLRREFKAKRKRSRL